ncbi:MAG: hypothetical protein VX277_02890 [Candidatus Thermoplasmatota archaeon]|nr:hypothetical protein [Candidatus Thermoplasmatota archaeon]
MDSTLIFPPQKIINLGNDRMLIIGMDGELQIINESLEPESHHKIPFPTSITKSSVSNNILFGFWVDLELMVARMAAIDLNSELQEGVSKSDLRIKLNQNRVATVSGSKWSHTLDSEPLAIVSSTNYVAFSTWKRGVYCIDHESNELWRSPEIKWKNNLENANVVVSMSIIPEGLLIWSKGAEWALMDEENGKIIEQGTVSFPHILEKTFNFENKILLCCPEGNLLWIEDLNSNEVFEMKELGPVQDAKWDSEKECWRICIWRKDVLWDKESIQKESRKEIGKSIFKNNSSWMVLDNAGFFTNHYK